MIKLNNVEISQEDLIKEITGNKELMDTLQAKFGKKESGWFVPKKGEKYFYLNYGDVSSCCNIDNSDKEILKHDQVFRTAEEAEKADQQRMAKVRILKRIAEENAKEGWVCDWSNKKQRKYFYYYDHIDDELSIDYYVFCQSIETDFYMSETVAKKLQTELLQDYKIYLGKK